MKNLKYLALSAFYFLAITSWACDFCGCATNGGSLGLLNLDRNSFLGMRYINQSYKTNDGLYQNSLWRNEDYNTVQIWSKVNLSNIFYISAILPYHTHNRSLDSNSKNITGLGDAIILGGFNVIEKDKHQLQLSAGVKLPSGTYDEMSNGSTNPGFQLGTGSIDFLLAADYKLAFTKFIWTNTINYNYKTENSKNYKFGNQLNVSSSIGYKITSKSIDIVPTIGIASEVYAANTFYDYEVLNTEGDITLLKFGSDVKLKNFALGFQYQAPIAQNLNSGLVKNISRSSIYINYNF